MKYLLSLVLGVLLAASAHAQVTSDRLTNTGDEPQNWLTYSGAYNGQRYSKLTQINAVNAKDLEMKWVFQANSTQKLETSPIVVNGVMYITQPPNDIVAMDAKTGRVYWIYQYKVAPDARLCCGFVNRGLAISGNTLYMGTADAHLVALDAKDGHPIWDAKVADYEAGYGITEAPLIVKDKVIFGMAGGERGIRGFVAAYSAETGEQLWKFNTVAGPGEPGSETWPPNTWQRGGGSSWVTGSYDPELNLVYWGIGNPAPNYDPESRAGDNLYTDSALALDADTGKLKWHFQFTPNDGSDWDSMQIPVQANIDWNGNPRKVLLWANRNGFFYVLDRANGKFLHGSAFVKQNWASGLDENGRPIRLPNSRASVGGTITFPGIQGGTNWYSPSYSPRTGLFYVNAWQDYSGVYEKLPAVDGHFAGVLPKSPLPSITRGPINTWTDAAGHGEVQAIDPHTGDKKWTFPTNDVSDSGILTTASDLLFTGGREGYFYAMDARSGKLLWKTSTGGQIAAAPITYEVDGKQYVAISAGHALFVFGLKE